MIEPAASRAGRRGDDGADHLDAWDRYRRILADQLAVLEAPDPDLDRFRELADQRDAVAREIETLDGAGHPEPAALDPAHHDRLRTIGAMDRSVLQKLRALGRQVGRAVHELDDRRPGRMGYLAGSAGAKGRSVDLTS